MSNQTMQETLEKLRMENKDFEARMRTEQMAVTDVGGQLNVTNATKSNLVMESHNIEADLMKTLNKLDECKKAFDDCLRQIEASHKEIEDLNAEDLGLNHANIDLASTVARI